MLSSPWLATHGGWEMIFYVSGGLGIVWLALFTVLVSESPEVHRWISEHERAYIVSRRRRIVTVAVAVAAEPARRDASAKAAHGVGGGGPRPSHHDSDSSGGGGSGGGATTFCDVPWGEFFRHPPLYGTILAHFCYNYMSFLGLSLGPYFFQTKYKVDISNPASGLGVYACLPYVVLFVAQAAAGYTADWLANSGRLTMTRVRKVFNTGGLLTAALFFGLLATPMVQEGPADQHGLMVAVALLTCAVGVGGIAITGSWANYYDLSSKYSPHLLAIGTSLSTIPGMITNIVSGQCNHQKRAPFATT